MKQLTTHVLLTLFAFAMISCAEMTQEQKVLSNIGVRNVIAQLIQRADNPTERAVLYSDRLDQVEKTLTPDMNDNTLIEVVRNVINARDLSPADTLLANDIMDLIPLYFKVPEGKLPPSAYDVAKDFIKQARFAVGLYK